MTAPRLSPAGLLCTAGLSILFVRVEETKTQRVDWPWRLECKEGQASSVPTATRSPGSGAWYLKLLGAPAGGKHVGAPTA